MLNVDDYRERILASVAILAPLELPLPLAHGCVLAQDIAAPWPLPSFDNSSMDGYAVVAADIAAASSDAPVALLVVDDVPAGSRASVRVEAGTAIRIMTGAPIPEGADAVVPVEGTDAGTDTVQVRQAVAPGACPRVFHRL